MTSSPPRLLLITPRLGGGGAQRVMELLARSLPAESWELHLVCLSPPLHPGTQSMELSPDFRLHAFESARARTAIWKLLRLIWKLRPRLILSGIFHLNILLLLLRPLLPPSCRVLVRQDGTASAAVAAGGHPRLKRMLYRLLYPRADRVICQSRAMAEDLRSVSGIGPQKPAVLPNPIEIERIRALAARKSSEAEEIRAPRLLAAGRLAPEKGFDLLLEALPAVRAQWPGVHLTLAGEGVEEGRLKRLAEKLGVRSSVCFAGAVQDLAALFSAADLFVLSSRREGLPNALLEAAAGGLPLLATPASGGVVDLLRDQPGCWISPGMTSAALAATLLSALSALSPGERFPHPFIESFGLQPALAEWNALLTATLEEQ